MLEKITDRLDGTRMTKMNHINADRATRSPGQYAHLEEEPEREDEEREDEEEHETWEREEEQHETEEEDLEEEEQEMEYDRGPKSMLEIGDTSPPTDPRCGARVFD